MLRDNLAGLIEPMLNSAGLQLSRAVPRTKKESSDDRPQNALKIPARQGGIYTLPENVASPFHAEPAQKWIHSYSGSRKYHTNSIEVLYAKLPQPEPATPLVISECATKLAEGFKRIWVERCSKYRNKRGWNCTRPLRK